MRPQLQQLLNNNSGSLPSHVWPGGYPVYYVTEQLAELCPDCANKEVTEPRDGDEVTDFDINWEDRHLHCDRCNKRIPSAYAEDEDDDYTNQADA